MGIILFIAPNKWQKCGLVPVNFAHILQGSLIGKLDSVPVKKPCKIWGNNWHEKNWYYKYSKHREQNQVHIDGLGQERRTSSALAMELCLSCINP